MRHIGTPVLQGGEHVRKSVGAVGAASPAIHLEHGLQRAASLGHTAIEAAVPLGIVLLVGSIVAFMMRSRSAAAPMCGRLERDPAVHQEDTMRWVWLFVLFDAFCITGGVYLLPGPSLASIGMMVFFDCAAVCLGLHVMSTQRRRGTVTLSR